MNVPPIEATSSADAGADVVGETRAPSRFAVPIACSPATPAPRTSTRRRDGAGGRHVEREEPRIPQGRLQNGR